MTKNKLKSFLIGSMITSLIISPLGLINECQPMLVGKAKKPKIKTQHEIKQEFNEHWIKPMEEIKKKELAEKIRLEELHKQQEIERIEKEKKQKEENQWIPVRCSFYTNDVSDCGKDDAISASGKNLSRGGNYCAAPKDMEFGTQLEIIGLGVYDIQDRGGAIVWRDGVMCLDIFIPNTSQEHLNSLGVKYTKARIIK